MLGQQHSLCLYPSSSSSSSSDTRFRYILPNRIVDGVIQQGPCCGMVALHLALAQLRLGYSPGRSVDADNVSIDEQSSKSHEVLNGRDTDNGKGDDGKSNEVMNYNRVGNRITNVETIINAAKIELFTSFGEMFSCENMASLANVFAPTGKTACVIQLVNNDDDSIESFAELIKSHFESRGLILIPYDKDVNFSPCMSGGKRAHWALLLGLIEVWSEAGLSKDGKQELGKGDPRRFVAARHGKSLRLAFWNLNDLLKSNFQLRDYDWTKLQKDDGPSKPVVPDGGVEEGLKGKLVFIGRGASSEIVP